MFLCKKSHIFERHTSDQFVKYIDWEVNQVRAHGDARHPEDNRALEPSTKIDLEEVEKCDGISRLVPDVSPCGNEGNHVLWTEDVKTGDKVRDLFYLIHL